jgi:predicted transcriptional regulator
MDLSKKLRRVILTIGWNEEIGKEIITIKVAKESKCTLGYTNDLISKLEKNGVITREKIGRRKPIKFTKKGWKIYYCLKLLGRLELE